MESELSVLAGMLSWYIKLGRRMISGRSRFSTRFGDASASRQIELSDRIVQIESFRSNRRIESSDLHCRSTDVLIFEVLAPQALEKNKVLWDQRDCQKKKRCDDR